MSKFLKVTAYDLEDVEVFIVSKGQSYGAKGHIFAAAEGTERAVLLNEDEITALEEGDVLLWDPERYVRNANHGLVSDAPDEREKHHDPCDRPLMKHWTDPKEAMDRMLSGAPDCLTKKRCGLIWLTHPVNGEMLLKVTSSCYEKLLARFGEEEAIS